MRTVSLMDAVIRSARAAVITQAAVNGEEDGPVGGSLARTDGVEDHTCARDECAPRLDDEARRRKAVAPAGLGQRMRNGRGIGLRRGGLLLRGVGDGQPATRA